MEIFWNNLRAGRNSVTKVPEERWSVGEYDSICQWGGFLAGVDCFDPLFFQIAPSEAEQMDPQQRLFFLEESWRALDYLRGTRQPNCKVVVVVYSLE